MADDLNTPLGQRPTRRSVASRIPVARIGAAALALFLGCFMVWAIVADDPFGGEPMVAAPTHQGTPSDKTGDRGGPQKSATGPGRYDGPAASGNADPTAGGPNRKPGPPGSTTTVNIINGLTGTRQEVTIPSSGQGGAAADAPAVDRKFAETTPQGPVPKIAADGVRPSDAFAQPVKVLPGKPDAPRIALIVKGLGVSAKATADAITNLPGAVTLGFVPYGAAAGPVALARHQGHEVLLQVPMEPFDYPENDPGPQTLLTSLTPQQNMERLYWLMSRFQGYVGLMNMMGARFTASEQSLGPVLRETARRGLVFVDDGSNPRSVAARIAGANNAPFALAGFDIDAVPSPDEIDHALNRLEMAARQHRIAVGISSALPVSVEHIAKWAKAAASRGLLLVPITAAAMREKQS